jgi:septum formation protein
MMRLILASQSAGRRAVLAQAGIVHQAMSAACDEEVEKARLRAQGVDAAGLALGLAEAKALSVSNQDKGALVLGCDQTLALDDGTQFDKAPDMAALAAQLAVLSGRTHVLHAAMAIAYDGAIIWRHVEPARMTMRPLSAQFIDAYLEAEGPDLLSGVGGYRIEGRGIQLFEQIEGSHFTIIGLPLLPLLAYLRDAGVIAQ